MFPFGLSGVGGMTYDMGKCGRYFVMSERLKKTTEKVG